MSDEVSSIRCGSSRKELESDAKHRRDRCMLCNEAPEYEVLWAEGMAHAWFCEKHLKEWLKASVASCAKEGFSNKNCELNSVKKLDDKEASKKFGENKNTNLLDSFLSKIAMPEVNKKKKNEKEEAWHKQESVGLQDGEELAPVHPSGTNEQKEITLEEVLPFFKSFYTTKPYVSLVGGLANNGKTKNDIDIFIRSTKEDVATEFRIYRMFPLEYRSRIHILYPQTEEDCYGVYTNYIDLYNLKLEAINVKHVELMSAIDERKGVKLFTFSKLLKPAHGRFKGELYSIDSLIELVSKKPEWYEKGTYVQKKFDGVHVRCDVQRNYESGYDVKIWTEEGNDITSKLPTLREALGKASKGHKIALVGELEFWKDKTHQSRQGTTAIIHTKEVHPEEKNVVFNFFDILFYDGDIHKETYSERLKYLKRIESSAVVKSVHSDLVGNEKGLRAAVKEYAGMAGSEGAYLKRADFPYELDGKTMLNLKYKNTFSIEAEVQDVHEVKGGKSWNYGCSIKNMSGRDVAIGRTYNTGIKVKEGDIIKVEFVNLNKYFDTKQKKEWYNWWSPRVILARKDRKRPDNTDTADKLVKSSHGEDKDRRAKVGLDADEYMSPPDETKTWLGMLHIHGRGRSVHGDLRFQVSKDWAIGWTLYIPKGLSKVPSSYTEFVELVKKEIMPVVEAKLKDPTKRFNCGKKHPEPAEWLDYKGMVDPGEIGATKNEPGFFYIADRFDVEYGAQKPHYHEYFCNGSLFKGRFCVALLENKEEWKKTDEGLMTWMAVAPKEKTPYVISRRAVTKKWIPGFGHSALPKKLRAKVPEKYRYWKYRETSKQREVRDELVDELGKKLVAQTDALGPAIYKVFRQTWKGPTVIREGASRTRYYFAICQEAKGNVKFALATQNNPLENKELACVKYDHAADLCALDARVTEVKPATKLNETKDTPSKIELLERGKASILSNKNFRRFRLRDGKLEGTWIAFQREEGSTIWTLKRANPE